MRRGLKGLIKLFVLDPKNSGLLRLMLLFSKLSIFLRRRIVFKFSPESLASFTYPLAKKTGENRSLRLFLASSDRNELERDCPHWNDQIYTL
jgi:hypothetical protein